MLQCQGWACGNVKIERLLLLYTLTYMSTNIYILKLQEGRFYVGKTENPMKRYQEHLNGSGSSWTRKYKPIGIEKIHENASPFEEDRYVKEYMAKHGMEKVRGGAYVLEELPDFQIDALKSELWGVADKCTTCGRQGHWAKDCHAKTDITGTEIGGESDSEESEEETIICGQCHKEFKSEYSFDKHKCKTSKKKKTGVCYRCGRPGHFSTDCYARTDKDGYELESDNDY